MKSNYVVLGLICFFAVFAGTTDGAAKPHIVYILADDMGHGDVRALRTECKFPTPHLNRLVNEGMAFTQAYSGSAICTPTRYGIMTGRYCWRDRVGLASGYTKPAINVGVPTVAEFLRGQGYRTRMVGKWHLGGQWTGVDGNPVTARKPKPGTVDFAKGISGGPVDHGFESWFGIIASLDMPPYVYFRDRNPVAIPTKLLPEKSQFGNRAGLADPALNSSTVLGTITDESIKVIREHDTAEPLFLYMALNAPHSPVVPSAEWLGRSKINEHADFRMEVDYSIGRILKVLEEKGILDDTLLIFTADNGSASFAVKGMLEDGQHDSSDGRRGWKATWFEGGHRVPFLVRWPKGIEEPGRKDAGMITLEDFFATVADVLEQPLPPEAGDSVSFLPQLQGKPQDPSQREIIMSSLSKKLVLRYKDWKLICVGEAEVISRQEHEKREDHAVTDPKAPWNERVALYNLAKDTAETTNVAPEHPAIVAEMARLAIASIKSGRTNQGEDRPDSCWEIQIDLLDVLSLLE